MNTLRLARVATRARSASSLRVPFQRRGYADAVSDKIKLTLALPHQVRTLCLLLFKSSNIPQRRKTLRLL